ncbi:MAG TPA: hypothetical protein VFI16_04170, partial [Anaeromyxobacteraceae bacterium]|nr:hypothetical protein [Anaeromyxobacteraceae bacterium]
ATRAFARSLARSGERGHPFPAALERASAEGGDLADGARALAAGLGEQLRAAESALRAPPSPAPLAPAAPPPAAEESRPGGG